MKKVIWKFPIVTTFRQVIDIPSDYEILGVQLLNDKPCIWALVDPKAPTLQVTFEIFGTGRPIDVDVDRKYVGTWQDSGVWHLFMRNVMCAEIVPRQRKNTMKVAYIAHPISGDVQANLRRIAEIGRKINLEEPDVIPFSPYFFDCHALDDSVMEERRRGIRNNSAWFRKGIIDEVRLYGDTISKGMAQEIRWAMSLRISIIPMTKETSDLFFFIISKTQSWKILNKNSGGL